jgi:hypothetical protein
MAKYWSSKEEKYLPIPKAAWYVLSNDSFMSGWGYAKGKINTCVVPCLSYHQAMIVRDYVLSRKDQKRVRIAQRIKSRPHVMYSLCMGWLNNSIGAPYIDD